MPTYLGRGLHGQVVETIATRIMSGVYREGEIIDVLALQNELSVSSTALREAVKVLTAKGMLGARQKRGTFVRPRSDWILLDPDLIRWQFASSPSVEFLASVAEVRMIVEPGAARLAAHRRQPEDLERLDAGLEAMGSAGDDVDAMVKADVAFHRALLKSAHNELLDRMETVISAGIAARDLIVHGAHPDHDPLPRHKRIVHAVRMEDADRADRAMRELLEAGTRELEKLYTSMLVSQTTARNVRLR